MCRKYKFLTSFQIDQKLSINVLKTSYKILHHFMLLKSWTISWKYFCSSDNLLEVMKNFYRCYVKKPLKHPENLIDELNEKQIHCPRTETVVFHRTITFKTFSADLKLYLFLKLNEHSTIFKTNFYYRLLLMSQNFTIIFYLKWAESLWLRLTKLVCVCGYVRGGASFYMVEME